LARRSSTSCSLSARKSMPANRPGTNPGRSHMLSDLALLLRSLLLSRSLSRSPLLSPQNPPPPRPAPKSAGGYCCWPLERRGGKSPGLLRNDDESRPPKLLRESDRPKVLETELRDYDWKHQTRLIEIYRKLFLSVKCFL